MTRIHNLRMDGSGQLHMEFSVDDEDPRELPCDFVKLREWYLDHRENSVEILNSVNVWISIRNGRIVKARTESRSASRSASLSSQPRASRTLRQTQGQASPQPRVVSRIEEECRRLLEKEKSWIHPSERQLLESFLERLETGRSLTERQRRAVRRIAHLVIGRKRPKFYRG